MSRIHLTIFIILALAASACKEEIKPTPYTYTQVFTGIHSKTWKVKFFEQTLNGNVEDTFTLDCAKDDEYTFYANAERAYKAITGIDKCSSGESDIIKDAWGFNNASATLTLVLPFFTESSLPFIVREAKKNNMELEIFLDQENTMSYRIHFESTEQD